MENSIKKQRQLNKFYNMVELVKDINYDPEKIKEKDLEVYYIVEAIKAGISNDVILKGGEILYLKKQMFRLLTSMLFKEYIMFFKKNNDCMINS